MDDSPTLHDKNQDDAAMLAGVGALLGAGLGACIGLLAANPALRRKLFSSYTDIKIKGVEVFKDIERIQQERNKRKKTGFLKGN